MTDGESGNSNDVNDDSDDDMDEDDLDDLDELDSVKAKAAGANPENAAANKYSDLSAQERHLLQVTTCSFFRRFSKESSLKNSRFNKLFLAKN